MFSNNSICITSIIRLTKIVQFRETKNPTCAFSSQANLTAANLCARGDYVATVYCTAIETYVSMIVPSLPAVRSLLSYHFPDVFAVNSQIRRTKTYEQPVVHFPHEMSKVPSTKIAAERDINADNVAGRFRNFEVI
jgi:hypothetical protein